MLLERGRGSPLAEEAESAENYPTQGSRGSQRWVIRVWARFARSWNESAPITSTKSLSELLVTGAFSFHASGQRPDHTRNALTLESHSPLA